MLLLSQGVTRGGRGVQREALAPGATFRGRKIVPSVKKMLEQPIAITK